MPDVLMNQIGCKGCMTYSRHPVQLIQRVAEINGKSNWFNYACPSCGIMSRQEVPTTEVHRFTEVGWKDYPDDMTVWCTILQCNLGSCDSHVVILAPIKGRDVQLEDLTKAVNHWKLGDCQCLRGGTPMRPYAMRIAKPWPF